MGSEGEMIKGFRGATMIGRADGAQRLRYLQEQAKATPTGKRIPILVSENAIATDATIGTVQVVVPAAETNDSWTQSGGNAAKSMGALALAASPESRWTVRINGGSPRERLAATPVIADGKLFVIDVDAVVHAFSTDGGTGAVDRIAVRRRAQPPCQVRRRRQL